MADQKSSYGSVLLLSAGLHLTLAVLVWAGLTAVRSWNPADAGDRVNTRIDRESYAEMEIHLDEPRRIDLPATAKSIPIPAKVESPALEPIVPPPKLEPIPAANTTGGVKSNDPPSPAAIAETKPNSGKGSPLHPALQKGRSIVYVLDRSASMGKDGKLREAIATLKSSLRQLSEDVKFQIVTYHGEADILAIRGSTDLVAATSQNLEAVEMALARLTAEGTSRHLAGLKKAMLLQPSAVFLLTDADDLGEDHLLAIALVNRKQTAIYPVLFGQATRLTRTSPFDKLAQANGGKLIVRD